MASRIHDDLPPGLPPVTYAPREPGLRRPPFAFIAGGVILLVASWVPLVLFARGRVERSTEPRIQIVQDMGEQPKFREQQTNELFADRRADRPRVFGTVARGGLDEDDHYFRGYTRTTGADGKAVTQFLDGLPKDVTVTADLLARGENRYMIYCSACHGLDGYGRGPIRVRSEEIGQALNVKSVHDEDVRSRPDGHIFNTITNGIRTMGGYSAQIPVADRWAIVAYVRALQVSQNPPPGTAPAPQQAAVAP
jgi:mono/diheme cytochrome c family protein